MRVSVEVSGITETMRAFSVLDRELRVQTNGRLRDAAGEAADGLALEVASSAASSGVPAAPLVASSVKVKRDRLPAVEIGGNQRVGRYGAPASALLWGTEHGGRNFAAGPSPGHWIAPAVERFSKGPAMTIYTRAVYELLHETGLA